MLRRIFQGVAAIILALSLIVGYNYLKDPDHLPVKVVKVEGQLTYLRKEDLQAIIEPYVGHSFIAVDIKALRHALQESSWVQAVSVRRLWPDTVAVEVVEQHPVAYWGDHDLVSDAGVRFTPAVLPKLNLPRWVGPDDQVKRVHDMYVTLDKILSPAGVKIASLSLSARWSWHAVLDSGLSMSLGSQDVPDRVARFVSATPMDLKTPTGVQYVDLRYTNGFVVNQAGR